MTSLPRRLRPILLSAASALSLFAVTPAFAESLQEALVESYNSNPGLLAERARQRATDEELAQANAGWRPTVTINGNAGASTDYSNDISGDSWNASITATQPLYEGGRVIARRDIAKAQIRAGRAVLAGTESDTLLSAVTAYMNVVRDLSLVELSKNQIDVLSRQRQAAQDRFDVGEITRTDVAQADAALSGAQTNLIATQANLEASRAAYVRIVGHAPGKLQAQPALPNLPRTLDEAIESALRQNPNLVAARENQLAAEAGVDLAIGALLPSVNLSASYSRGETNTDSILSTDRETDSGEVGIGASVPLYQGGAEYSSIRQAKQTNSQNRLLATLTERQATEAVTNAWEGLAAAKASIQSAEDQVRASEIAYEGVRQEAEVGARTTLDVLNAEQALLDAKATLITNQSNVYIAAYSLRAAMGTLSASDLGLPVEVYDPVPHGDSVAGQLIGVGED
ncbi:Outer membrane efflux protein BepC [Alphaproteobacteria bacterium SO-S41]|nr:Outer membrane efflux protein BepC [Alphaproteobacteria bacterium SO-S41]